MKYLPFFFAASIAFAQSPQPTFDVASIKLQPFTGQGSVGVFQVRGNTLTVEHVDLYSLIEYAYGLRMDDLQLSGGPSWARHGMLNDSTLFQVIAKASGDTPPPQDQFPLMMQTLLADRFQLKIHHTPKDLPVLNLVVAKNGPKLKESAPDAKFSFNVSGDRTMKIVAVHSHLLNLMDQLSGATRRPVFDKTGLAGFYDFDMEWHYESMSAPGPDASSPDTNGPSVFTAVQERLGLKLEPATAPFDTLVIDHAEKPSEN